MKLRRRFRISLLTLLLLTLLIGAIGALRLKWNPWVLQRTFASSQYRFECASPDGRLVLLTEIHGSAGIEEIEMLGLRIINLETGTERILADNTARFSPDSRSLVSILDDGTVRIRDTKTLACRATLSTAPQRITNVDFSPDCSVLVTTSVYGGRASMCLWDARTGTRRSDLTGTNLGGFSPDGCLLTTLDDFVSVVWDVERGTALYTIRPREPELPTCVLFSDDNRYLAVGESNAIKIYGSRSGEVVRSWKFERPRLRAFSPDSQWLVVSNDEMSWIYPMETGSATCLKTLRTDGNVFLNANRYVQRLRYSINEYVDPRANGYVYDLDRNSYNELSRDLPLQAGESLIELRNRIELTASTMGKDLSLWDLDSGSRSVTFKNFAEYCRTEFLFSRDSKGLLAIGQKPDELWLWDISSGNGCLIAIWQDNYRPVSSFSTDDKYLTLASPHHDTCIYYQCRGYGWMGFVMLPEFWIATLLAAGLIWRLVRAFYPRPAA